MLQTISQPAKQAETGHRVPKDSKYRPWVKQRLSSNDLDVERIHANWIADGKGAENVAMAFRLADALLRGDLDAARVAMPALNFILPAPGNAPRKNRPPSGSSDSDSERSKTIRVEDLEGGEKELALALAEVTGADLELMDKPIARLAVKLARCNSKYTADDVRRWYTSVWKAHWPGSKGDPCDLDHVEKGIGRVKALPPEVPTSAAAGTDPGAAPNPYVADKFFTQKAEADVFDAKDLESPEPRPEITGCRAADMWLATLGQLQIQLNRSTYDTWLRHAHLVEVDESSEIHRLVVTVPHDYARDWINRHLLHSMTQTFNALYCGGPTPACKEAVIAIQVDGAL